MCGEKDSVCEVAVYTGGVGRHARACGCVSRGEFECGVQSGRRDTQVYVGGVETATATVARQMPGSGGSCIWDHPGSARQRTDGPFHATDETPTCSAARVRPGPETHAVDVADPADGQRPGWVLLTSPLDYSLPH